MITYQPQTLRDVDRDAVIQARIIAAQRSLSAHTTNGTSGTSALVMLGDVLATKDLLVSILADFVITEDAP